MENEKPIFTVKPLYRTKCEACDGTGIIMTQNGPDDFNQDACDECGGNGYIAEGGEKK